MEEIRRKPVLGPHLGTIEQILADDRVAPPKQRHTARRIFERLRDEHGYRGCYFQVQTAVKNAKQYSKEAFVPLSHPPGHSQFDFGEAMVEIAGARCKAHLGLITLPYSDTYFLSAYPRECTETFQASHVSGFNFFGGVPLRISYDNTTIAVSKIIGAERELTRGFMALESHYLFDHHFCHVGRGNEKGHVENHVGYARRNLLVPVPSFPSWATLNEYLAAACYADLFRRVRGKVGTKAERLAEDRAAMLALPAESFEPRRVAQGHANSLSLVRFDRNDYSVPTAYAHHEVTVLGGIEDVAITSGTDVMARHPRHWGKEHTTFDPIHYLALLERKPGAIDFARPLENWGLPECFATLRRRLEADLGHKGTREFIKVLRLLEGATLPELTRGHPGHRHRRHGVRCGGSDPVPPRRAARRALQPRRAPSSQIGGHRPPRSHGLPVPDGHRIVRPYPQVTFGSLGPVPSPLHASRAHLSGRSHPNRRRLRQTGATP